MNCALLDCELLDLVLLNSTTSQAPHHLFPYSWWKIYSTNIGLQTSCQVYIPAAKSQKSQKSTENRKEMD